METIEAEARAWIIRMDGGPLSEGDRGALGEWLRRSPAHARALDEMAEIWAQLDELGQLRRALQDAEAAPRPEQKPRRAASVPMLALAAAAVLFCASAAIFTMDGLRGGDVQTYETALGEQRVVVLPDGSEAQLNTATTIDIEFAEGARQVRLLEGEAVFDVAHDARQPFIVFAEGSAVRAVGTEFSVRTRPERIDVTVTEGAVDLIPTADSVRDTENAGARLVATQTGVRTPQGFQIRDLEPRELERMMAWRGGALVFEGDRLSEVLDEWSRYTPVRFEIEDPELRNLGIGGRFEIGDTEKLLDTLQTVFGVDVTRETESRIVLSMRED